MSKPLLQAAEYGNDRKFKLVHEDTFPGTELNKKNWYIEDMRLPTHRCGNEGMDGNGELKDDTTVAFKRWSAWYHKHHDKTLRVNDGLHLGVHVEQSPDPTRPQSFESGDKQIITPGEQKLYLGWAGTARSIWSEPDKCRILDPASPGLLWRYGFFEIEADFNGLWAEGIRQSAWLTAFSEESGEIVESKMYDRDPRELECDFYEIEVSERFDGKHNNFLQMKNLAGDAGNTPGGNVDCGKFNINLLDGKSHVIGHFWEDDRHTWYLDGYQTNQDRDRVMQVLAQLTLSREGNSGLVGPLDGRLPTSVDAVPPYLPRDPGLYLSNCFADLERARESVAVIRRVSVWEEKPVPRQKAPPAETSTLTPIAAAPRDGGSPVVTDREFQIEKTSGVLTWRASEGEAKWNIYLDGEYHATVEEPRFTLPGKGRYEVEGISNRSVAAEIS